MRKQGLLYLVPISLVVYSCFALFIGPVITGLNAAALREVGSPRTLAGVSSDHDGSAASHIW
jgi:hypothetical protein